MAKARKPASRAKRTRHHRHLAKQYEDVGLSEARRHPEKPIELSPEDTESRLAILRPHYSVVCYYFRTTFPFDLRHGLWALRAHGSGASRGAEWKAWCACIDDIVEIYEKAKDSEYAREAHPLKERCEFLDLERRAVTTARERWRDFIRRHLIPEDELCWDEEDDVPLEDRSLTAPKDWLRPGIADELDGNEGKNVPLSLTEFRWRDMTAVLNAWQDPASFVEGRVQFHVNLRKDDSAAMLLCADELGQSVLLSDTFAAFFSKASPAMRWEILQKFAAVSPVKVRRPRTKTIAPPKTGRPETPS